MVGIGFVSQPRGSGGGWHCGITWKKLGRQSGGGSKVCRAVGMRFAVVSLSKLGSRRYPDGGFIEMG